MDAPVKNSFLFTALAGLFCVALIVSNIIAGKLWAAPFGLFFTTAVWLFPIVYIIGDVVPEVYGLVLARKVIMLGFLLNLVAVGFYYVCLVLPPPVFWQGQEAFMTVLSSTPRLLIASFTGYLIGSNANALVLVWIKRLTDGKWLWMRTISSTIVGEALDTLLFTSIAFYGTMPNDALFTLMLGMAGFKILYEVLATPLTYAVVGWVRSKESA
jgi:hypothetical protein